MVAERGSPWPGLVVFFVGFGVLVLAVVGVLPSFVPVWPTVATGAALAALGVAIAVRDLTRPPPAPAPKPAHLAFLEKQRHAVPVPTRMGAGVEKLDGTTPASPPAAATGAPASPLEGVEEQLREVSREIGRAKVMYGTGKLSSEGYRSYVADLETKRGDLEAKRARILMGKAE